MDAVISTHAPRVGSDHVLRDWRLTWLNFNSRSPCGERPAVFRSGRHRQRISTHAPRVGSDLFLSSSLDIIVNFNSRSPCGERPISVADLILARLFQLTLPVWGATFVVIPFPLAGRISTHAPRVGSDLEPVHFIRLIRISTHAPRVGSDGPRVRSGRPRVISTHAPRVGSDLT